MSKEKAELARNDSDRFGTLRQMTSDFDRAFERWPVLSWPEFEQLTTWSPKIEAFEKDNRLVTRIDLPGTKKDDVTVTVTDTHLTFAGGRKRETEEKKTGVSQIKREYSSFSRSIPLPDGVKPEDVNAILAGGVLEISVPFPAQTEAPVCTVPIEEPKAAQSAA